ncbi:hypothetical protein BC941DRAFT_469156 [Chlamydoabsidia padenii]|nr:hypothetical protein BC941DRAFT_469156 [Chlamydoabsidia padenii]
MAGKSLLIAPPSEPSHTNTSTRFLRSLKGVRHWWTPRHNHHSNTHNEPEQQHQLKQQQGTYSKSDGIAMTLTATIDIKEDIQTATTLDSTSLQFTPNAAFDTTHNTVTIPSSSSSPSPTYNARAFVHYDPTKPCLALGTDAESNQTQTIWLSLERYTWLISQLHEEQNVYAFLKNCFTGGPQQQQQQQQTYRQSAPPPPSTRSGFSSPCLGWYPFLCTPSPILGVLNARCTNTTPLARRLSRFVQRGGNKQQHHHLPPLNDIYLFMIPKALLLQAGTYIPMTKPLPPMYPTTRPSCTPRPEKLTKRKPVPTPFTELSEENTLRLERYVQLMALTAHDLMATPTPSPTTTTTTATTQATAVDDQINFTNHDLVDGEQQQKTASPPHQHQYSKTLKFELVCGRCGLDTCLDTVTSATSAAAAMEASHLPAANDSNNEKDNDKGNVVPIDSKVDEQQSLAPCISVSKTAHTKKMLIDSTFTITYFQPILNTSTESAYLYPSTRPYSHSPLPINIPATRQRDVSQSFNTTCKRQQTGTHKGSADHLSCSESGSISGVTTGSLSAPYQKLMVDGYNTGAFERRGYIAIDHAHKEIHVVFPGLPLTRNNNNSSGGIHVDLDPSFFTTVPWFEEGQDDKQEMDGTLSPSQPAQPERTLSSPRHSDDQHQEQQQQRKRKPSRRRTILRKKNTEAIQQDTESSLPVSPSATISSPLPSSTSASSSVDSLPWVLNGALIAWRRCELNVATLLMRACKSAPEDYKVIMVGNGLGSAVAALCALSLVSTGLLSNRSVTYCGIHPPRIGDHKFGQLLSNQHIETIRIMDPNDIMAHLPPRTSGLVHIGNTTIIDNKKWMIQGQSAHDTEDIIDRTLPSAKTFDMDRHGLALDIDLYPLSCSPSIDLLTIP